MTMYSVMHTVYASTVTEVEADSVEQAIELAGMNASYSVCNQCSKNIEVSDLGEAVQVINLDTGDCHSIDDEGNITND